MLRMTSYYIIKMAAKREVVILQLKSLGKRCKFERNLSPIVHQLQKGHWLHYLKHQLSLQ